MIPADPKMADKYKPIFFTIISLTVVWFIVVLLCLPQQTDDQLLDHGQSSRWSIPPISLSLEASSQPIPSDTRRANINYSSATARRLPSSHDQRHDDHHYPHRIPNYMKYFQGKKHRELSKLDIIFYQLNGSNINVEEKTIVGAGNIIAKDQHIKETLELKTISNPTDRYVKSEGDRLFAFNLLVSNRIGIFRPIPDTRHPKCDARPLDTDNSHPSSTTTRPVTYPSSSKASIIICYFNEAPSALLRTIYSVLKRTNRQYLQEIIVVDDYSEAEYDITKVKPFIDDPLVVLTRTKKREGLIRARLFGSDMAKGSILLFLDSHVEPNVGWIEPLIDVVRKNKTTIACPVIDLINAETLIYTSSPLVKGGMNWALNFKWDSVPAEKLKTYDDFVRPIESPTMAGGLFAIDSDFFYNMGSYDPGMELWGGENIELSLRTWMCGGKIVILPCSRVGHIFRKRRPYGPEENQPDSLLLNSHRVARVWLDNYIEKFYEANPDAKYLISGDVSKRLDLRHKLRCKHFSWFIENIYPDLILKKHKRSPIQPMVPKGGDLDIASKLGAQRRNSRPQRHVAISLMPKQLQVGALENVMRSLIDSENSDRAMTGHHRNSRLTSSVSLPEIIVQFQIQSKDSDLCIESKRIHTGGGGLFTRLVLRRCAKIERNNEGEILINNSTILDQIWTETELHDLRLGPNRCLDVFKNLPFLRKCHSMGTFQDWTHNRPTNQTAAGDSDTTNIFNTRAGLCLGVERVQIEEPIIVTICDKETYERHNYTGTVRSHHQSWRWRQKTMAAHSSRLVGFASLKAAKHPSSEYNFNQTGLSQSWTLLLVTNNPVPPVRGTIVGDMDSGNV